MSEKPVYKKKDFISDQEVRWCPGCGDFGILSAVQMALADLARPRNEIAIVSGIGCSGRIPHYLNTYGLHGIHGRAVPLATGLTLVRPELKLFIQK